MLKDGHLDFIALGFLQKKEAFQIFDRDRNGYIDRNELRKVSYKSEQLFIQIVTSKKK